MSTNNPFLPDRNTNDNSAFRAGRPSRTNTHYRDVDDSTLAVLVGWWDEAETEREAAAERKARMEAWSQSDEAAQARAEMRGRF